MNIVRKQHFCLAQRPLKAVCIPEHINMIQTEDGTNDDEWFISAAKPLALNCSWIWTSVQKQNSSLSRFSLF